MKLIKFNLPLNGTSISTLEQLQNNITPEILDCFRSGKLNKWIQTRSLTEQANKLEKLISEDVEREINLLKNLYEIFGNKVDKKFLQSAITEIKKPTPTSQLSIDEEVENINQEFSAKELAYQQEIKKLQQEAETFKADLEKKDTESEWKAFQKNAFHAEILMKLSLLWTKSTTALFLCETKHIKVIATEEVKSWFEGIDMEKLFEESKAHDEE